MTKSNFERFDLPPFLIRALDEQGFTLPTEIQERLILAIKGGRDVIGQSQTGSGKTLAFLLPIIATIDPTKDHVQAVITAPTRELAAQLYQELGKLLPEESEITARLLVGGTDRQRMIGKLKQQPHIVVGTPGRVNDLIKEQALSVYEATKLVVDEADQMLDMGFIADVDQLAARMAEELQMLVFSATIPKKLQPFLKKYMTNPRHVHVKPEQATEEKITHQLIPLKHRNKHELLAKVAKALNPYLAIIFTNTKEMAEEVANAMIEAGLNVDRLHGGLQPRERKQVMRKLNDATIQYVVATDLAARGIDIKGISHVINFEFPKDLDFYIHRVGRTARAGADGIAVSIYEPSDQASIEKLMKRGIAFTHIDYRNGSFVTLSKQKKAEEKRDEKPKVDVKPEKKVKPKQVKPGYKKKAKIEREKRLKRERRLEMQKKYQKKKGEKS